MALVLRSYMTSGHEKKASRSPPPTDIGERDKGDRQERSDRRRGGVREGEK